MKKKDINTLLDYASNIMNNRYTYETYKNSFDWDDAEDIEEDAEEVDFEGMLTRVMLHLHSTGEDVLLSLKDEELRAWWSDTLKDIEHNEAVAAAKEKAMLVLSDEERKLLGLSV